jgi:hypothetical protein
MNGGLKKTVAMVKRFCLELNFMTATCKMRYLYEQLRHMRAGASDNSLMQHRYCRYLSSLPEQHGMREISDGGHLPDHGPLCLNTLSAEAASTGNKGMAMRL